MNADNAPLIMRDGNNFQTPRWVCKIMCDLIDSHLETILEPTPGKGNLVSFLKKRYPFLDITAPRDFFQLNENGKFDLIIGNPPFSPMNEGYKILYRTMKMSDEIIMLMPWLTLINSQRRTKDIVTFGLKEVIHLPRNAFKGARVQTCILHLVRGFNGTSNLRFCQDTGVET